MRRLPSKTNSILDTLHKGFVCTCIAVTAYGFAVLGNRYYCYLTQTKPILDTQKQKEKEILLAEGSSDHLLDTAKTIKL
ncbi:unnamed protein product [Brassicogethes aeneus]|uniref:Uncharacterized protein n=1 Tax=Brassicogethes aeneus TaxID=1431903 RepID=A0A9P0B886_BRAAE|nr:unnamed protein product [Brassicogethes aeneus]